MTTAFQANAFQNNAFQIDTGPTPIVKQGGGGGRVEDVKREHDKRNFIRRELEKAIRESLQPPVADEPTAPVKLWTRPQRARAFPNYWKEQQVLALLGSSLNDVAAQVAQLVAQQKLQYLQMVRDAEDRDVAMLVAQMMADGTL